MILKDVCYQLDIFILFYFVYYTTIYTYQFVTIHIMQDDVASYIWHIVATVCKFHMYFS